MEEQGHSTTFIFQKDTRASSLRLSRKKPPLVAPKPRILKSSVFEGNLQSPPLTSSTAPLLAQRFRPSPKLPVRQVRFQELQQLSSSLPSSPSSTSSPRSILNFDPNAELDHLLWRLHQSINETAFESWQFRSYKYLRSLDKLLKKQLQVHPSQSDLLGYSQKFLLSKINPLVVHCADVFRYFWAILTAPNPAHLIFEPITDTIALLKTVLSCETFSSQLTTDAYLYLVESTLLYLLLYKLGAFAAFPPDKQALALATAYRLYCFVDQVLLQSAFRMDLYRSLPLTPGLVTSAWLHLYACYLEPGYSTVHTSNPFTRSVFSVGDYQLSSEQIRRLLIDFLQTVLGSIVNCLNDCPPLLRRLHYPSLVIELERIEALDKSLLLESSISQQLLSTLSKYPSTVGSSSTLVDGVGTHQRLNRLIFALLFETDTGGGSGSGFNSLRRRNKQAVSGDSDQQWSRESDSIRRWQWAEEASRPLGFNN